MIDPTIIASSLIVLVLCGICWKLAGDRKKLRDELDKTDSYEANAEATIGKLRRQLNDSTLFQLEYDAVVETLRTQGRELAELRAKESARKAQARAAAAKGHASQSAAAAARRAALQAEAPAITLKAASPPQGFLDSMREYIA